MKNATELRHELSDAFMRLKRGEIKHADAAELANIAGKMINSAKVQVEYYAMRGDAKQIPTIEFLESTDQPKEPKQ